MANGKGGGFLAGALIGVLVGAGVALLAAPKKGSELRGDLSTKYQGLRDKTMDVASTVGQKAKDYYHQAGTQTTELIDKAQEVTEQAGQTAASKLSEASDKLNDKFTSDSKDEGETPTGYESGSH